MDIGERTEAVSVAAFVGRLLILGSMFSLALLIELRGTTAYSHEQLWLLWMMVAGGFGLAAIYGLLARYAGGRGLCTLELAGDGLLITGLVYCTGGPRSLFGFLFVLWIVHAAMRSGARAAVFTSLVATGSFGIMSLGSSGGWLPLLGEPAGVNESLRTMGAHTLGFVGAAVLAHSLARIIRTGKAELHELVEIHRRIVDNVSSGLLTVGSTGLITSYNPEAERITGYSGAEVMGWPLGRLFPDLGRLIAGPVDPQSSESEVSARRELAKEVEVSRGQVQFRNQAGEELYLGFSFSPLLDEKRRPEGSVLIFRDLTHVVQMEEQLRRSQRLSAVGQLAAGLAHEIRNPLASLSGAIELLSGDLASADESSGRLVRIVQRETARLDRLVRDFLSYAGPAPTRLEAVCMAELLDEIRQLLSSGEYPGVELCVEVPDPLTVQGDPDQLRQVFWNLVLNAVEAGPQDQKVRIRGSWETPADPEKGDRVVIEVIDSGAGIPEEILEQIFEPFFTTKPKGTGLGLSTVHRIVEAHGGTLLMESQPGQGTTARVILPGVRA